MRLTEQLKTIGWGVFCACSWTWCIGMYLPVIMFNRYGWAGFLAFAVPNVLGCAGMGYVLGSRGASERIVGSHRTALGGFSLITIAFHAFFLSWLFAELTPFTDERLIAPILLALGALIVGIAIGLLPLTSMMWLVFAAAVYAVSLLAFISYGLGAHDTFPTGDRDSSELIALAPIIAFGFLLCPYLDATFHRARQESPSTHAFGVFGVTFAVMILFTPFLWFSAESLRPLAFAHLLAQSIFTVGAHTREIREAKLVCCPKRRRIYLSLAVLVAAAYPALRAFFTNAGSLGESLYLRFLVFYGLAFPLYVLLFVGRGKTWAPTTRLLVIAGGLALLLAPFYEAGFIHLRTWWLLVPVAVIIAITVRRASQTNAPATISHGREG